MNSFKKYRFGLSFLLICLILSSCGPSPEEQQATAAAQTAAAATNTPQPTYTPLPTKTATPTPAPTPTPTPDPDPMTMVDHTALNLPDSFVVDSPDYWGIERGAVAIGTGNSTFLIENSFVFTDESRFEVIFGYTSQLAGSSEIREVDEILSNFLDWFEGAYGSSGVTITNIETIPGADQIGDKSAGVRIEYIAGSTGIVLEQVMFRIGDILATTNVKNFKESESSVSVIDAARVYAQNIQYPIRTCQISKITPLVDQSWPTFNYQASGFYPGESILVVIGGNVQLGGNLSSIGWIDGVGDEAAVMRVVLEEVPFDEFEIFGFNMEPIKVDNTGSYSGSIMQTAVESTDAVLSDDNTITVYGLYSGCATSGSATWQK